MASVTWWTRVWVNSGSWWWTGRPGVLRFMGSQRVGHDWATELNWTELIGYLHLFLCNKLLSFTLFCWIIDFSEFFVTFWKLDFDICLLNIFPHLSFLLPFLDVFALFIFSYGQIYLPFPFWFWLGVKFIFLTTVYCCLPCN